MDCPKCGAYNETEVGSCLSCGASLAAEDAAAPTMMKKPAPRPPAQRLQQPGGPPKQCPNCMTLNAASFKFCARCGTPLTPSAAAPPPKVAGWPAAKVDAKPSAARPVPAAGKAPAAARPTPPPPPKPGPGTRPPASATAPKAGAQKARARISAIARDGSRSADYVLTQAETRIGR